MTNDSSATLQTRGRYVYDVEVSFVDSDSKTIVQRVAEGQIASDSVRDVRILNDNKKNCFKES